MAHETQITGKVSEMTAALALISNGWEISQPLMGEVYDLLGYHPTFNQYARLQVKSLRRRTDRNGEMVIPGKKSNGQPYQPHEVDYMIGVDVESGTVYMTECVGHSEYWASETTAAKRWVTLSADNNEELKGAIA